MVEWYLDIEQQDKKRKKKLEQINKELQKRNELQSHLSKSKLSLQELQNLVKEWVVTINDKQLFEKIVKDDKLEDHELDNFLQDVQINDLLRKIEEIEKIMDIDAILPKELRIKPQDFALACKDPVKRKEVLQKLDDGLDYIIPQVTPSFKSWWNPFARRVANLSNLVFLAHKKVIDIQWHMIDIKSYLCSK